MKHCKACACRNPTTLSIISFWQILLLIRSLKSEVQRRILRPLTLSFLSQQHASWNLVTPDCILYKLAHSHNHPQVLFIAKGRGHDSKDKPDRHKVQAGEGPRYMHVQHVRMTVLSIVWTVDVCRHKRSQVLKVGLHWVSAESSVVNVQTPFTGLTGQGGQEPCSEHAGWV